MTEDGGRRTEDRYEGPTMELSTRALSSVLWPPSSVIWLRESAPRRDPVRMQHLSELAVIVHKAGAIGFAMPQVQDAGCEPAILAAHTGPDEADEQVGVLPAPAAERGVEPAHFLEVRPPERHVAAARAAPAPRRQLAHPAKPQVQQRRQAIELTARARQQPPRKPPRFGLKPLMKHTVRQLPRHQNARTCDEPARLGDTAMRRHEIGPRDAIAVEKEHICAGALANAAIADIG